MKQSKKKSFLKSKKTLIAAALAALMAMAGVTYAWFTWSVGMTGGTLKMDYVQINAEYGAYLNIIKMFDEMAVYFENNENEGEIIHTPAITTKGWADEGLNNIGKVFVAFENFQDDKKIPNLKTYLKGRTYSKVNLISDVYVDEAFDGVSLYDIFVGAQAYVDPADTDGYIPFFAVAERGFTGDGPYDLRYEYMTFRQLLESDLDAAADILNLEFQHELPANQAQIGYRIQNLGAACYIALPDVMNSIKIWQGPAASYDAGTRYNPNNTLYAKPNWGVAQYGNYVLSETSAESGVYEGWSGGVRQGAYFTGQFDPNLANENHPYTPIYDVDVTNINVPYQRNLMMELQNLTVTLPAYGYAALPTSLPSSRPTAWSIPLVNALYAESAKQIYGDTYYDVYPATVTEDKRWKYDPTDTDDSDGYVFNEGDWRIEVVPASGAAGSGPKGEVVFAETDLIGIANAFLAGGDVYVNTDDPNDFAANVMADLADYIYGLDTLPEQIVGFTETAIKAWYEATYSGTVVNNINWARGVIYANSGLGNDIKTGAGIADLPGTVSGPIIPKDDLTIITIPTIDGGSKTVLDVKGDAFTYKTADLAPEIWVMMDVKYGKYLDNRFVGSEIVFDRAAAVAVQRTPEAAQDVFFDRAGLTVNSSNELFIDVTGSGKAILASRVTGLPTQYKEQNGLD
ncbi:MAG: hypothetical protein LBK41_04710 [Clostridiales bacterium]|jgi:hypothetical protein|nr:hypothetical protein [Clostridiales bacterium]